MLPIVMLGSLGFLLFGVRECRHADREAATLADVEAATNTTVVATVPAVTTTTTQPPVNPDAAADRGFTFYEQLWREGQFSAAAEALRTINGSLPGQARQRAFWDRVLPPESRILLTLATPCSACTGGTCTACSGSGRCATCGGERTCRACLGKPVRTARCTACICTTCRASGQCTACRGFKLTTCPNCAGGGGAAQPNPVPCEACAGKGYRVGLQGGDRLAPRLSCSTCNGSGRRMVSRFEACVPCNGSGRVPCAACAGKGLCSRCAGRGHAESCRVCNGDGITRHTCSTCSGNGQCVSCRGSARCSACAGRRLCQACVGKSLIRHLSLPAHPAWLAQHQGYLTFSDAGRLEGGATVRGPQQVSVSGRDVTLEIAPREVVWLASAMVTGNHAVAAMRLTASTPPPAAPDAE